MQGYDTISLDAFAPFRPWLLAAGIRRDEERRRLEVAIDVAERIEKDGHTFVRGEMRLFEYVGDAEPLVGAPEDILARLITRRLSVTCLAQAVYRLNEEWGMGPPEVISDAVRDMGLGTDTRPVRVWTAGHELAAALLPRHVLPVVATGHGLIRPIPLDPMSLARLMALVLETRQARPRKRR